MKGLSLKPAAAALAALTGTMVAGCTDSSLGPPPTESPAAQESVAPEVEAGASDSEADVAVRIIEGSQFAGVLDEYRGRAVLVDFWATWCLSCLEQFPHTVELSERFADRGLAVISVSLNEAAEQPQVLEKLRQNGATFDNFLSREGMTDEALEGFGLDDGILPQYRLYDREGNLHKSFSISLRLFTTEEIDRAVEELLGQSADLP